MASLPELGTLIHILIKPLLPDRQVELLNKQSQLGMERSQKGKGSLEELN